MLLSRRKLTMPLLHLPQMRLIALTLATTLTMSLAGCVSGSGRPPPPPTPVVVNAPPVPKADREKTTVRLTKSPYVNVDLLIGALNIANAKNARNVERIDERDAILAGKSPAPTVGK